MSPRSRGRKPHHKPHARRDPRRENARAARQTLPDELLATMLSAGRDIVRGDGPFEAETIASSLIGIWWGRELIDADIDEVIGEAIIEEAARRRTPESLALLSAMAAVTQGRLAIKAATAANTLDEHGVRAPSWLALIGKPNPVACYRTWDTTGDGFNVISLFAYEGQTPHATLVFVDRNLGGLAKDAWAVAEGEELVSRFRDACRIQAGMNMDTVDPAEARALVERAIAVAERALPYDPPISDESRSNHALALARMRLLPEHPRPHQVVVAQDQPFHGDGFDEERRRFLETPEIKALGRPRIVRNCVDAILDYADLYDDGRLLRVSAVKIEVLLNDWLPNWAELSASEVDVMPEVLELWCRHAASRTALPKDALVATIASIDRFGPGLTEGAMAAGRSELVYLREHITGRDIWERTDCTRRLVFSLLTVPGPFTFGGEWNSIEDDLQSVAESAHPEYAEELDAEDDTERTVDGVNPRMHVAMHSIVANQLWLDEPPDVWATVRRIQLGGYDQHEIHHMLMNALGEPIRRTLVEEEDFDVDLYRDRLAALPGSWEAERPS